MRIWWGFRARAGGVFATGRRARTTDLATIVSARRASHKALLRAAGPVEKRCWPSATRAVASPAIHDYASVRSKARPQAAMPAAMLAKGRRAQGDISPWQFIAADDRPRGNASQSGARPVDLTASGRHSGAGGAAAASKVLPRAVGPGARPWRWGPAGRAREAKPPPETPCRSRGRPRPGRPAAAGSAIPARPADNGHVLPRGRPPAARP